MEILPELLREPLMMRLKSAKHARHRVLRDSPHLRSKEGAWTAVRESADAAAGVPQDGPFSRPPPSTLLQRPPCSQPRPQPSRVSYRVGSLGHSATGCRALGRRPPPQLPPRHRREAHTLPATRNRHNRDHHRGSTPRRVPKRPHHPQDVVRPTRHQSPSCQSSLLIGSMPPSCHLPPNSLPLQWCPQLPPSQKTRQFSPLSSQAAAVGSAVSERRRGGVFATGTVPWQEEVLHPVQCPAERGLAPSHAHQQGPSHARCPEVGPAHRQMKHQTRQPATTHLCPPPDRGE